MLNPTLSSSETKTFPIRFPLPTGTIGSSSAIRTFIVRLLATSPASHLFWAKSEWTSRHWKRTDKFQGRQRLACCCPGKMLFRYLGLELGYLKWEKMSKMGMGSQAPQAQNTWCMRQLVYIENCMGKSPIVKELCNYLIWNKVFLPQLCRELISCADFKAILTPLYSGVIWNHYSSF